MTFSDTFFENYSKKEVEDFFSSALIHNSLFGALIHLEGIQ